MNRAEVTQKTKDEIYKAVKFCSGSFPIDGDSIEPYVYKILDIWDEYSQQVSREMAIEFASFTWMLDDEDFTGKTPYEIYDTWLKQKEGSNE